eukprot:TRINITY_DN1516_c0_g1_i1.p1 TRINITY_DN1516_c0_g1~~TRINITY_DN1516_c0_g1_i1.p1  ORF type:complete len:253 (-),score=51.77 TRINITY_DN1516_c0_g1_i1:499-1257(-)
MALASMYQRIPYSILSEVNKKKPQNYAILKLPPSPSDRANFAEWERQNAETTTTFDEVKAKKKFFETHAYQFVAEKVPNFRDVSFARWETHTFPKDIDFESALERIELSNMREPRVIKYKLNFADGCHILLTRANWEDPSTLYCTESYNPNGTFDKTTAKNKASPAAMAKKRSGFLVNEKGHLTMRPRDDGGQPLKRSIAPPVQVGKAGYSFTPMSYVSHEVKPNVSFPGVRPGIKETNKAAFQYLRRTGTA